MKITQSNKVVVNVTVADETVDEEYKAAHEDAAISQCNLNNTTQPTHLSLYLSLSLPLSLSIYIYIYTHK